MGPAGERGSSSRGTRSWKSPSLKTGFSFRLFRSASSSSSSISYVALAPGIWWPMRLIGCLGSHRPPPVALQITLARRRGYASSSPRSDESSVSETCTTASACDEETGERNGEAGRRGEVVCARREDGRTTGEPSSGVERDDTTDEDADESGSLSPSLSTVIGVATLMTGERGVLTPCI